MSHTNEPTALTPRLVSVLEMVDQMISEGHLDAEDLRNLADMARAESSRQREAETRPAKVAFLKAQKDRA